MDGRSDRDSPTTRGVMDGLGIGPCVRLPLNVDAARIAAELSALPDSTWRDEARNPAVQNDVDLFFAYGSRRGPAAPAEGPRPVFERLPSLRTLLVDRLPGVLRRSLVARLPGNSFIPLHTDSHEHHGQTVRIVIPVATNSEARLFCDGRWYAPAMGEIWAFDNLRQHGALNDGDSPRIHVLADLELDDGLGDLIRNGRTVGGIADEIALARVERMTRKQYARYRWRRAAHRLLERLHLPPPPATQLRGRS